MDINVYGSSSVRLPFMLAVVQNKENATDAQYTCKTWEVAFLEALHKPNLMGNPNRFKDEQKSDNTNCDFANIVSCSCIC